MSAGGNMRSHRGGTYGRGGRTTQGRGRATYGGGRSDEPRRERELGSDNEPFMLSAKPSSKESQRWITNQNYWARGNLSKYNWHLILNMEGGLEPVLEIVPEEPDYENFADRVPEYNAKHADWRDKRKEITKRNEEMETDGKKLYGQLIKYLSPEFVLNIKSKYGDDFLAEENSKRLVDAINSEFLGMNTNGASGNFEVAESTRLYNSIRQQDDQAVADYFQRKNLAYRTVCQGKHQLQVYNVDARTFDEIFNTLIEPEQRVADFIMGLNRKVFEPYLNDLKLQRGGEEWPMTVTDAYERASQLEDHLVKTYRSSKHFRDHDTREKVPVMYAGAKGAKGSKGQGEKSAQKTDSKGKKICHHEERNGAGSCPRKESCWFSHDIDHAGTKGAAKPKEKDPHCGGGPGPGPGKG